MSKTLFIVESPNKIATVKKYLGGDYTVMASVGHIRSIPRKGLNIDIKNDFKPTFEITPDKKDVVQKLKNEAKKVSEIIIATDEDREGEAIAWHIYEIFNKEDQKKCKRVTFDSITKTAIEKALKNKRDIDMDLVHAQHARQILDRLVGYKISPLLWFSVQSKTSAGRVQSIALKILSQREIEINDFKPTDFWYIDALLQNDNGEFWAKVVTKDKDNRYLEDDLSKKDLKALETASFTVESIDKKEKISNPYPPFDTSSLLQAATSVFKWPVKKTTKVAQSIYEIGICTYIRSDSFSIAPEAMTAVRELIGKNLDKSYLPEKPNYYKKKSKSASQEAHECIRPTDSNNKGDGISDPDQKKLYKLIRDRFIASQLTPMVMNTVTYNIKSSSKKDLIAKGQTIKFDGWSKVYKYTTTKENELPVIEEKEKLNLKDIKRTKNSTQPPPHYNEATLVKKLESEGVGRPSTYASIMDSVQKRGYVQNQKGSKSNLEVTELGLKIFDYLESNFKDFFMDIGFTASMEDSLGDVAEGKKNYLDILNQIYDILQKEVKNAQSKDKDLKNKTDIDTGEKCVKCEDGFIVKRNGKFGDFYACDKYPKCKATYIKDDEDKFNIKEKAVSKSSGIECPECKKANRKGILMERKNKKDGSVFLGCNNYPKCKHTESVDSKK